MQYYHSQDYTVERECNREPLLPKLGCDFLHPSYGRFHLNEVSLVAYKTGCQHQWTTGLDYPGMHWEVQVTSNMCTDIRKTAVLMYFKNLDKDKMHLPCPDNHRLTWRGASQASMLTASYKARQKGNMQRLPETTTKTQLHFSGKYSKRHYLLHFKEH